MTEIVEIKGKQYILKDGVAYEIKEADVKTVTAKPIKRKQIKYNEIQSTINKLTASTARRAIVAIKEINCITASPNNRPDMNIITLAVI